MNAFSPILSMRINDTSLSVDNESFEFSYSQTLEEIIEGKHRSKKNKARDQYRDPLETLKFFGIKNTMTVVEIYP